MLHRVRSRPPTKDLYIHMHFRLHLFPFCRAVNVQEALHVPLPELSILWQGQTADVGRGAKCLTTDARAEAARAVDAILCSQRGAARAAGACLSVPPGARGSLQAHGDCHAQPLLVRPRAAHVPPLQGLRCKQSVFIRKHLFLTPAQCSSPLLLKSHGQT